MEPRGPPNRPNDKPLNQKVSQTQGRLRVMVDFALKSLSPKRSAALKVSSPPYTEDSYESFRPWGWRVFSRWIPSCR
jgi:hypothetical protein